MNSHLTRRSRLVTAALVIAVGGCAAKPLPPVVFPVPARRIDYLAEVKPLLDKRCAVCHSCYNSPCQLKLDSFDGVDRGATKRAVYNASRLHSMDPTRLFTDARTTAGWRDKEFFSVTGSSATAGTNDSTMIQLLAHKMNHPRSEGDYSPDTDELTCAENGPELGKYLEQHPNRGMPYGFPPLKQEEFETIAGWLVQGARGPDPGQQRELETPKPADAAAVLRWEAFLNADDAKHAVTARYLYEHLFLAHASFGTGTGEYFELVRSRSAPGAPLDLVATVRPYDDPGVERVYYRFRKIHSTIVAKTHMVFDLDEAQMARLEELFIRPEWLQPPHRVGYEPQLAANPFAAFEQIPPRSRYQFLLDNAHYVIKTFIHGPVCKGQVALDVINDHFWVMFVDPDHDLSVLNPGFLRLHRERLRMPIERGSDDHLVTALIGERRTDAVEFYRARQDFYAAANFGGLGYEAIWRGSRATDAPVLTVYRHFDSASVHRGALGSLPKTSWVIDYPLLERIYYALVAGFDVYGNAGHQLAVRLYMDLLRVEGESYFLDFLPPASREPLMQSWYLGVDLGKIDFYPSALPAGIAFATDDPKREFLEHVVRRHVDPATRISLDPLNYLAATEAYPQLPAEYRSVADFLQGFRAVARPGTAAFSLVHDHNANLAYLRVRLPQGRDIAATIVVNRWHQNVAFLFREEDRLVPEKDAADFLPGLLGSYPNYFFDVRLEELPDFLDLLEHYSRSDSDLERLRRYGVNRADERFWEVYDWFQRRLLEDEPVHGGLLDLNRYFHAAR